MQRPNEGSQSSAGVVCDYVLKDVKRPQERSVYQQEGKRKMRAYWARGMEQFEMLSV